MNNIEKLKTTGLFTNYIYKAIPLAFDESMSYYETLCGLLSYLKDTVIPTVNNNADAVIELQNLYTELHDYVEHYFDNLDVQEEINHKLDEMTDDGVFDNLIKSYADPIIEEQNNQFNNFKNNVNNQLSEINNKVDSTINGNPLPVSSTSEMIDTSKIYVNTTDGNWYYYNGTSWTIGGAYLSSSFSAENLKGIFKKVKVSDLNLYRGGYSSENQGEPTTTPSRFKNVLYMRPQMLIKNNNIGYNIYLYKYNRNLDNSYSFTEYEVITDNILHYINYNCDAIRIVVYNTTNETIQTNDFKTLWNNIDFYLLDDKKIIPEQLCIGNIVNTPTDSNFGALYRGNSSNFETTGYNLSHYILPPYKFIEDTVLSIKIKKKYLTEGITSGYNLFVFNEDKYLLNRIINIHDDLEILVKENYYIVISIYANNNFIFNTFELDDILEITSQEYSGIKINYYKIPFMVQHKLYMTDLIGGIGIQGITNNDDYIFTIGCRNGTDNDNTISKISKSDLSVVRTLHLQYGHGNSICYNSKNNTLIVAGLDPYIYVLDADTLNLLNTIDIKTKINYTVTGITSISFNEELNIYAVFQRSYEYSDERFMVFTILDSNFDFIEKIDVPHFKKYSYANTGGHYSYNNMFGCINTDNVQSKNRIIFLNWLGKVISYLETPYALEVEGYTLDKDDNMFILFNITGYQNYNIYKITPSLYRLYTNDKISNNFLGMGNEIQYDFVPTVSYDDVDKIEQGTPSNWLLD